MRESCAKPGERPVAISCRRVSKRLGAVTVLEDVDLTVARGEFVAVVGPSGSGKSTLLGLVAGLDRPTTGEIEVEDMALRHADESALCRLRRDVLGFVFQSFQLLGHLTAFDNVLLPLELKGCADAEERARSELQRVGLWERARHHPAQLSGGEQQRVALARAFAARPRILLADEPTGSLDARTGDAVLELLLSLRAHHGTTLVLVTHDAALAARADRRVTLERGRVLSTEAA